MPLNNLLCDVVRLYFILRIGNHLKFKLDLNSYEFAIYKRIQK
jgi:hypothetical protein